MNSEISSGQLSLDLSERNRNAGMDRVAANNAAFLEVARRFAREYCRRNGSVTSDQVRVYMTSIGMRPSSKNAWGCLFKERGWTCVGRRKSELPSNHARWIGEWIHND